LFLIFIFLFSIVQLSLMFFLRVKLLWILFM
jgi:hypothetical protein